MSSIEKKYIRCFHAELMVRVADINYGWHVGNDRFLSLAQEARVLFFRELGSTELDIDNTGIGIIVSEAHLKYLQEAFLGQLLKIEISVDNLTLCSLQMHYLFINKETGKEITKISTKIVFMNYKNKKIVPMPSSFKEKIAQYRR